MNAEAEAVLKYSWKPAAEIPPFGVMTNPMARRSGFIDDFAGIVPGPSKYERFAKIFLAEDDKPSARILLEQALLECQPIGRPVRSHFADHGDIDGVTSDELRYQIIQPPPEIIKNCNAIFYSYVGHVLLPACYKIDDKPTERLHPLLSLARNAYPAEMPPPLTIGVPERDFNWL